MSGPKFTHERMAELLHDALTNADITQAELARRSGMTEKHVSRVLTGKNTASMATLDFWAFLLGNRFVVTLERVVVAADPAPTDPGDQP